MDSASTSSTSLPTSVSKMIFTGVASAASARTIGQNAVIQQASRSAESRKPKAEGRNKLEIRSPESEAAACAEPRDRCLSIHGCILVESIGLLPSLQAA